MREIVYENDWADYEEGHSIVITQESDRLFSHEVGHCVMTGSWDEEVEVTWAEALELIDEWEAVSPTSECDG